MKKLFKPNNITVRQSFYVDGEEQIYTLRVSNGVSIFKGAAANMTFYGKKKYISKVFHALVRELGLPEDRLNWKKIDMGRQRWEF